jgi:hypothetical protein
MKVIIYTQYRENYGFHDWDGEGECPQYWKNKGGDSIIVITDISGLPLVGKLDVEVADKIFDELEPLITYKTNSSQVYVLSYRLISDGVHTDIPDYEPEIFLQKVNGEWVCTQNYYGKSWYGSADYSGMTKTYTLLPKGERKNFQSVYVER